MDLLEIMLNRRSVRTYQEEDIPQEKLEKVLQAGLLSPTSRNLKPCEFYVIRDREMLKKLSEVKNAGAGMIAGCKAAIAVFGDSQKADTWVEDCSIAMSFMMLMAQEQGIGSCWVQLHFRSDAQGTDAEKNTRDLLGVPGSYRIAGVLALGMPDKEARPHTLEETDWNKVHWVP